MRSAARAALRPGEANVIAVHSRHAKGEAGVDLAIGPGEVTVDAEVRVAAWLIGSRFRL